MFLDCILDFYCTLYSNVMYGQGFSAYKFSSCHHLLPSFLFVSFLNWSSCIWITWRRSDRYRNTDRSFFYNLNVKLYQLFIWIPFCFTSIFINLSLLHSSFVCTGWWNSSKECTYFAKYSRRSMFTWLCICFRYLAVLMTLLIGPTGSTTKYNSMITAVWF